MSRIVCQLYGFRKEIERDPYECFRRIREIGYDTVQLDGMRGRDAHEIKDAIDKAGLKVSSMHIKHGRFINDVEGIIEECKLFNCWEIYLKYIEDEFQVEYGYKFTKYALVKAAKELIAAGCTVGFHSPEYDFNTLIDGKRVMDYICTEEEGIAIHPEPDTYWLTVAGVDPIGYCQGYAGRILTLHMKDIDTSLDPMDMHANLRECGAGNVDMEGLMRWGYANGVKAFAIEQDYSTKGVYESFKESLEYLSGVEEKILAEQASA